MMFMGSWVVRRLVVTFGTLNALVILMGKTQGIVSWLFPALDWEVVRCGECGAVIGEMRLRMDMRPGMFPVVSLPPMLRCVECGKAAAE